MSWHFSRALVEAYSERISSDLCRFVLSNEMSTVDVFSCDGSAMGICQRSRYGMTFTHLKVESGRELLTSYLADSRVRHFPQLHAGEKPQLTCGLKCDGSLGKLNRPMCSPRTSQRPQLNKLQAIAPQWVIKPKCFPLARQTWVLTTFGNDIGYLHTPTTKANYCAQSMQKWPSARAFKKVFGRPNPLIQEWMMGLPAGWSDTKPLEMRKCQLWQQQLYGVLQMLNSEGVCE